MDLNGEAEGNPTKMPVALIDVLAGHQLKEGLLLALLKKDRTGSGSLVEVSLIQTAIASLTNQATNWLVANQLPVRQGSAHPNIAPYGDSFVTKDGKRVLLAVGNDKQFNNLISILPANVIDIKKFATNRMRVSSRAELNILLSTALSKMDSNELLQQIHRLKIPAGIIQNVKEVFEQKETNPLVVKASGLTGVRSYVAQGIDTAQSLLPPPHFGEHTQEVLAQLTK
jgi:crotonobetainyl-CoA:carnitine CoA-transferase CaiB-like acyl-CoA transferase